ncbi:MAG: ASKHA domain-containing protein [Verrucomicrobiota bacterium]|nr:ASKHA domain-containing protein [Verrucomicrobiota bacterium]
MNSGTIKAPINILNKKIEITVKNIDTIYIVARFGNYIRRTHPKRIGIIPDIESHKIHFIGILL